MRESLFLAHFQAFLLVFEEFAKVNASPVFLLYPISKEYTLIL